MTWKNLGVSAAVVLGVSLGSAAVLAEPENGEVEALENEDGQKQPQSKFDLDTAITEEEKGIEQEDIFDPAEVEDRVFLSAKGHQVKFWRDGKDQWRADVIEDFTGIEHEGLPVGFGEDWSVEKLVKQASSKYRLYVLLRNDLPDGFDGEGLVYVGSRGLKGGIDPVTGLALVATAAVGWWYADDYSQKAADIRRHAYHTRREAEAMSSYVKFAAFGVGIAGITAAIYYSSDYWRGEKKNEDE